MDKEAGDGSGVMSWNSQCSGFASTPTCEVSEGCDRKKGQCWGSLERWGQTMDGEVLLPALYEEEEEEEEEKENEEQKDSDVGTLQGAKLQGLSLTETELEELRAQVLQLVAELEETRELAGQHEDDSLELQGLLEDERLASAQQAETFTKQIQKLQGELRSLTEEMSILEQEKKTELKDIEQELQLAHDEIQTLRQAAEDAAVEHEGDIATLQEDLCRLRSELTGMERIQEEYEMEINSLRSEIQLKDSDRSESMVFSDVNLLQEELQQLRDRCNLLTEEYHALQMSNSSLCEQLEVMESQRYCSEDQLDNCRTMRVAERWLQSQKKMSTTESQTSGMDMFGDIMYNQSCEDYEDDYEEESENLRQQLHGAEEQLQKMQNRCKDLYTELQELQKVHQASEEEQKRLQKELTQCKDEMHRLKSSQDALIKNQTEDLVKKLYELQKKYQESQHEQASLIKARNQLQEELLESKEEQRKLMVKRASLAESNKNEKELKAKLEELQNQYHQSQDKNRQLLDAQKKLQEELKFCGLEVEHLRGVEAANQEALDKNMDLEARLQDLEMLYQVSQEEQARQLQVQEELQEALDLCQQDVEMLRNMQAQEDKPTKQCEDLVDKLRELQELYHNSQKEVAQLQFEQAELLEHQRRIQEEQGQLQEDLHRLTFPVPKPNLLQKSQELLEKLQELEDLQTSYQSRQDEQKRLVEHQNELLKEQARVQEELRLSRESRTGTPNGENMSVRDNIDKPSELHDKYEELRVIYQASNLEQEQLQEEQGRLLEERRRLQEDLQLCQEEMQLLQSLTPRICDSDSSSNRSYRRSYVSSSCSLGDDDSYCDDNETMEVQDVVTCVLTRLQTVKAMYVISQDEHGQMQVDMMQLLIKLGNLQEELELCKEAIRECESIQKVEEAPPVVVQNSPEYKELQTKLCELQLQYQASIDEQSRLLLVQEQLECQLQCCQEELCQLKAERAPVPKDNRDWCKSNMKNLGKVIGQTGIKTGKAICNMGSQSQELEVVLYYKASQSELEREPLEEVCETLEEEELLYQNILDEEGPEEEEEEPKEEPEPEPEPVPKSMVKHVEFQDQLQEGPDDLLDQLSSFEKESEELINVQDIGQDEELAKLPKECPPVKISESKKNLFGVWKPLVFLAIAAVALYVLPNMRQQETEFCITE